MKIRYTVCYSDPTNSEYSGFGKSYDTEEDAKADVAAGNSSSDEYKYWYVRSES